ncbi:Transposase, IS1380 family [Crocosphaera watsonii WH 0003]|uniref:Transposase, IS1380 family n=1 Tax=Crocosphaera watsonii WH 0003 TaxID=423471 RepID=G5J731_CROWT|nr:Transposase, IS1380 family [Crocosphaera watsonii WH 0003]
MTKVCYGSDGLKMRHVVTSLPASKIPPSKTLYKKNTVREARWKIGLKNNN